MTPKPLPSIRTRLSLSLLGVSLVWWLAVSIALGVVIQHEIDEVLDNAMQESAVLLLQMAGGELPAQGAAQAPVPMPPAADGESHLAWQRVDRAGQLRLRSASAPLQPLAAQPTLGFFEVAPDWRVYGLAIPGDGVFYVAQELAERHDAQAEAIEYTAGVALAVVLVCALYLRRRLRRELQPLERLSAAVGRFDPLARDASLPPATRAELLPVQEAITGLGQRLAQRVSAERAFSAHAAHALRTPLAGLDAQLAVALRELPPEGHARLLRAREAASRLQQVVTALLGLFRSGGEPRCRVLLLSSLLAHLPAGGLELQQQGDEPLWADPDLLAAALANLLDNAARHGAGHVQVGVRAQPGGHCISLQDDGPGMPAQRLQELQQALSSQDYAGRTGLGLLLADRVVRAHGGQLRLEGQEGQGCRVEIFLPGRPAAAG